MTDTMAAARGVSPATVRGYRPADHNACRGLWAELTEHSRELHGERHLGAREAGAGFEEYLTQLNLSGMWVAEDAGQGVIGFIGLMLEGSNGEVDPVVVSHQFQGRGVGRALLGRVVEEARRRGLTRLSVTPPVRDESALHTLHAAGFHTLTTVTVAYDLAAGAGNGGPRGTSSTLDLHGLRFDV